MPEAEHNRAELGALWRRLRLLTIGVAALVLAIVAAVAAAVFGSIAQQSANRFAWLASSLPNRSTLPMMIPIQPCF